jgi:hypothetical protein
MVDRDPQDTNAQAPPVQGEMELLDGVFPPIEDMLPSLRTWTTLEEEAAFPDYSYTHQINTDHWEDDWETTLHPLTSLAEASCNPNYNAKEEMFEFADSLEKHMFLIVKESRFELIYGLC